MRRTLEQIDIEMSQMASLFSVSAADEFEVGRRSGSDLLYLQLCSVQPVSSIAFCCNLISAVIPHENE